MHTVESISALVKNMREDIKKGDPVTITTELVSLVDLINCIDGMTFRNHYGEVIAAIVKGNCRLNIEPTNTSKPEMVSGPKTDSKPLPVSEPIANNKPANISAPTSISKPNMESEPKPSSNPPKASAPESPSKPQEISNIICIRTSDVWACDNEKCGKPDLIMEMQRPALNKTSEQIRYQCLTCCFIGTAELTREEIEKAMIENKPVNFEMGKTNVFDFLNQPRPKKRKSKAEKEAEAAAATAAEGTPLIDAMEAGNQHMRAIAQEAKEPARKKKEGQAEATTFPGPALPAYNQIQAPVVQPPVAPETKAAVEKVVAQEVTQIKEVETDALLKDMGEIVGAWPLDRLVKEWETMTGKTYKQGVTIPDAMRIEVANRLAGVPTG